MTSDGWRGPRRRPYMSALAGGLLAMSLFGTAIGIGLIQPQTEPNTVGGRYLIGRSVPAAVARVCHVPGNLNFESIASLICVGFHLSASGGGELVP